jgi:hypothetical protein
LIEVRKLAAVDMVWLGTRVIVAEYALGVVLPLALGSWSLHVGLSHRPHPSTWQVAMGSWLVTIAVNYIPLLIYALMIAKAGSVEEEGQPEIAHARRYGAQQVMILVPLMVAALALAQERGRRRRGWS